MCTCLPAITLNLAAFLHVSHPFSWNMTTSFIYRPIHVEFVPNSFQLFIRCPTRRLPTSSSCSSTSCNTTNPHRIAIDEHHQTRKIFHSRTRFNFSRILFNFQLMFSHPCTLFYIEKNFYIKVNACLLFFLVFLQRVCFWF